MKADLLRCFIQKVSHTQLVHVCLHDSPDFNPRIYACAGTHAFRSVLFDISFLTVWSVTTLEAFMCTGSVYLRARCLTAVSCDSVVFHTDRYSKSVGKL